jgi:hypothetical protein
MWYSAWVLNPTPVLARPARRLRPWLLAALALVGLWLFGLGLFVARRAPFEAELPRRQKPSGELCNLSRWDFGPTVRASSFYADWVNHHHPLFVVDAKASPDMVEKWASAERDPHPWIEILWREEHSLERVVLRHAGSVEGNNLTARRYRITCLQTGGRGPSVDVDSNTQAVATHDLPCEHARGIHIDFERNDKEIVRVYEVETWGR